MDPSGHEQQDYNATQQPAGVTPAGEVSNEGGRAPIFRAGALYEDSVVVGNHTIEALAEVEIDGNRLILKDIAIYSTEGNIPNEIGFGEFKSWLNFIKKQAKDN